MGKLTKNYVYNLLYQMFSIIVPLLTAPYLLNVLGPDGTGIYGYVNSVVALITTMAMLGIYSYGSRQIAYVRDNKNKLQETFSSIYTTRILLALIGTLAYIVTVIVIRKYTIYFVIYFTYAIGFFLDCTWLYVGVEDMKWSVIKNFLVRLLGLIGIFVFIHSKEDTWKYLLIIGMSTLCSNLMAYTQLNRYVEKPKLVFKGFFNHIKASVNLFLPNLAYTIYLQCDKIMIESITGQTAQVSYYDYSEKIVTIPLAIITVLNTVVMPRIANEFANGKKDEVERIVNSTVKFSMFLSFPMMIGMIVASPKLVPWYLGTQFIEVAYAIMMISPIIVMNSLTGVFGSQYFTATNQINVLLKSQLSAVLINIICNTFLIKYYMFYGAAIATFASSLVCATIQFIYIRKQLQLKGFFLYLLKYAFISLLMGGIVLIITVNMLASPLTNIIQVIIGTFIYFGGLLAIRDEQALIALNKIKGIFHHE